MCFFPGFSLQTNGEKHCKFLADYLENDYAGRFCNVNIVSDFAGIQRFVTGFCQWACWFMNVFKHYPSSLKEKKKELGQYFSFVIICITWMVYYLFRFIYVHAYPLALELDPCWSSDVEWFKNFTSTNGLLSMVKSSSVDQ